MVSPSASASAVKAAFSKAIVESDLHCDVAPLLSLTAPLYGDVHYHKIITVVSGVATILTLTAAGWTALSHMTSWVNPAEQKQIVRIVLTLPVFATCAFFSCWFNGAAAFIQPISIIVESFGIAALFLYYVACVTPQSSMYDQFFDILQRQRGKMFSRKKHINQAEDSLGWYHLLWILVFQLLIGRLTTSVLWEIFNGTQCPLSRTLRRSTLGIQLIVSIQTIIAVVGVVVYMHRMRKLGHLASYNRPLAKLLTFKGIVLIELVQAVIFKGLGSMFVLRPTVHVSYRDITIGTPNFMICVEMFIFSCIFIWSYSYTPYLRAYQDRQAAKEGNFLDACYDVLNIWDLIKGVGYMFVVCFGCGRKRKNGKMYVNDKSEVMGMKNGDGVLNGTNGSAVVAGQNIAPLGRSRS